MFNNWCLPSICLSHSAGFVWHSVWPGFVLFIAVLFNKHSVIVYNVIWNFTNHYCQSVCSIDVGVLCACLLIFSTLPPPRSFIEVCYVSSFGVFVHWVCVGASLVIVFSFDFTFSLIRVWSNVLNFLTILLTSHSDVTHPKWYTCVPVRSATRGGEGPHQNITVFVVVQWNSKCDENGTYVFFCG